jgi:hypothetical protein
LVLDFSKRSPNDAGCFTAPRARAVTVAPVAWEPSPVDAPKNLPKSPSFNAAAASLMSLSAAPIAC